jgi:predicted SAM-dependent methyltransferase
MELARKLLKNWRKIRLSNLNFYFELFKEETGRFRYRKNARAKLGLNPAKKAQINGFLKKSRKLHVGCGYCHADGFINIDAFNTPATDFVCHIQDLPKYIPTGCAEMIYLSHTLEHFSVKDSIEVLGMFYDFLADKGELRLSVPDLLKIAQLARNQELKAEDKMTLQGIVMGGQDTRYNYHKSVYWFDYLKEVLSKIGFRIVEEYPLTPHFIKGFDDVSSLAVVNNTLISLNVRAIK